MKPFVYERVDSVHTALGAISNGANARLLAGGTCLLDLMKLNVEGPDLLVDINHLEVRDIALREDRLHIGALARMTDIADHPLVRERYRAVSEALLLSASQQLRDMASIGGNVMQRTRCYYFRDTVFACNKRDPGSGCDAIEGESSHHAVFGASSHCIAVHASDVAVPLVAFDAHVVLEGARGSRRMLLEDFYLLPGSTPERETAIEPGEIVVGLELPADPPTRNSRYLKVRDRASYEFPLVSVCAALDLAGTKIRAARLAMGAVAPKPWRLAAAEEFLRGRDATLETFREAAELAMIGAQPAKKSLYKLTQGKAAIVRALSMVGGLA